MNTLSRQIRHLERGYHLAAALLLLPALVFLSACGGEEAAAPADATAEEARTAIPVEVVVVDRQEFEDTVTMTGTVEAPDDATLAAESAGTVTVLAPLGVRVGRGQVVAQINPSLAQAGLRQAQAALESAQAQLELAEDQYRRQEPLYADSIISALEFQGVRTQRASALAQVAQAEAAVAQAQEQVENTRVRAPFGGTVEEQLVDRGEQVTPGMPVLRLVSTGRVKVRAGVPERYAGEIEQGTPVTIVPEAYSVGTRRGSVTFVGAAIDPQSRTFPVEVELDNATGELKPEMTVRVEVTRAVLEEAIAVPLAAVIRDERGTSVYVVEEASAGLVAQNRPVELGSTTRGLVVVESGLSVGEEVIVQGQTVVAEGDPVRIVERHATAPVATAVLSE